MAVHRAPPSLGFSRQEHWSGVPFPSPMHESESEVAQSSPTLSDLMDYSPPGSSVHGIFQARVLEWGAIAFSGHLLSHVQLLSDLMDCSPSGSSVHRILQARIVEWVSISLSRGSSQPGDRTCISCIAGGSQLPSHRRSHLGS